MELLPLHIEYLLTRHACVIVPGVGAFIVTENEASFNPETGIAKPGRRNISFNSSVISDDGLLSHSIARREHLPYEVAHRMLTSITEKLKADLRNEGEASIGMVGRLVRNAEGLVSFEPKIPAACSDINREEHLTRVEPIALETAAASDIDTIAALATSDSETEPESAESGHRIISVAPDRYVFTIKKKVAHIAAMFAVLLTIGISLLAPVNHINEQKASVLSFDAIFRSFKTAKDTDKAPVAHADSLALKQEMKKK